MEPSDLAAQPYVVVPILMLAAARITRLGNVDTFGKPIRLLLTKLFSRRTSAGKAMRTVDEWGQPETYGYELATCPWCLGFWVSVATVAFYAFIPDPWGVALLAPWALSYVVGVFEGEWF